MKTFMQTLHCVLQPQIPKHPTTTHTHKRTQSSFNPLLQCGNKKASKWTIRTRRTHTRYLSSPAAATLQGKTKGFVLRLSPQIKPHATLMQLLQCALQHHVANPHLFTHMATQHENIHADITLRSTTADSKTPYNYAHTHTNAPKAASTHCFKMNGSHPSYTRGTFHRRLQPLYTEEHKVSCSGFLPKSNPMQHSCSYYDAFWSITSLHWV